MRDELLALWPDEDAVAACIKHEAETVDPAVFLAVHQPMRFLRYGQGAKQGTEQRRTEQDLLDEFLQEKLPEGRLILPIEGSSGVGKSHVIRWIDAQLERRPDRDTRHVIRVPKGMSLKGVLRTVLSGLDGPRYEELRTQLLQAREQLEPRLAARHLILNICHRLEQEAESANVRIRDGKGTPDDKLARDYGDKRNLPALIGDSELLHSHWLTRESDGAKGVMTRLAEHITEKADGPEDQRLYLIGPQDLVISQDLVERLNRTSQRFYQSLHSQDQRLADAARLINRVLDDAKQDLFQLGEGSLTDLFRSVREELLHDGKELVLLVEDFAVLSGMQGALLQVMITEAYRDGVQVLCTMRSALAYTPGVAHVPETVRTRAGSRWVIEDHPGSSRDIHARVVEMVGAYLNAARVGQEALQNALKVGGEDWIPIVDWNDLEDGARSAIASFGKSNAGHPLFPFNAQAVRQLTEQGSRKNDELVFNPRNIINNVLTKVLRERAAFAKGRFPHKGLAETVRSAAVTNAVARSIPDEGEQDRVLTLVACWGDQPDDLGEAAALPAALFLACGLPQPAWGVAPAMSAKGEHRLDEGAAANPPTAPRLHAKEKKEQKWKDVLEEWGMGADLDQHSANELRQWIALATLEYIPWGMLPLKLRWKPNKLAPRVFLPRSRGQGAVEPDTAFLVVARGAELDNNAFRSRLIRQLMAFVRSCGIHEGWTYNGALEDAALCANFLEMRAEQAHVYLRAHHFRPQADTIPALAQALLIGARALGVEGGESRTLTDRASALLCDAAPPTEPVETPWGSDLQQFAKHRNSIRSWLLEQVGARQGKGTAIHAIDITALEPSIREVAKTWTLSATLPEGDNDPDYKRAAIALRALSSHLPRTLRDRRAELLAWHASATEWLGDNPNKDELRDVLRETLKKANKELPGISDLKSLRRTIDAVYECALKSALDDCGRLRKSDDPGLVLSVLARNPDPVIRATRDLMNDFDIFLSLYGEEIETRLAQHGEDAVAEGTSMLREELTQLQQLLSAIEDART